MRFNVFYCASFLSVVGVCSALADGMTHLKSAESRACFNKIIAKYGPGTLNRPSRAQLVAERPLYEKKLRILQANENTPEKAFEEMYNESLAACSNTSSQTGCSVSECRAFTVDTHSSMKKAFQNPNVAKATLQIMQGSLKKILAEIDGTSTGTEMTSQGLIPALETLSEKPLEPGMKEFFQTNEKIMQVEESGKLSAEDAHIEKMRSMMKMQGQELTAEMEKNLRVQFRLR